MNIGLFSFLRRLSLALLLSPIPLASLAAQSAYRLSDEFNFRGSRPAEGFQYLDMRDGRQIAYGDFDLVDGELSGGLALLDESGRFSPLVPDAPVFGVATVKFARNSDGGYHLFAEPASYRPDGIVGYHIAVSATGELLSIVAYPMAPLALQPDGKMIRPIERSRGSGQSTAYYQVLERGSYNASGAWVAATGFGSPEIHGEIHHVFPLASGDLLVTGFFTRVNDTTVSGQLIRLTTNGSLVSGFQLGGLPSLSYPLYQEKIFELPDGALFLFAAGVSGAELIRLRPNGTRDPAFDLSDAVHLNSRSRIVPGPGSDYFVLDCARSLTETSFEPISRINSDGSIDPSFSFDPDGFFQANLSYTSSARLADGTLLTRGALADGSYGFAIVDASGKATPASPGEPQRATTATATWTANGELQFWNYTSVSAPGSPNSPSPKGIARADGSIRALFHIDTPYPLISLPSGDFVAPDFGVLDRDGQPTGAIETASGAAPLLTFPDGRWLAVESTAPGSFEAVLARLHPDGAPDPTFEPIAIGRYDSNYFGIHGEWIYYSVQPVPTEARFELRRASLDGSLDPAFRIEKLSSHPRAVSHAGAYVFLYGPDIDGKAKPYGARFSSNGAYDSAYAPEATLAPVLPDENTRQAVYASDGSMIHLATEKATGERGLFHIPPSGKPARIDGIERWTSAYIEISPDGDAFVSGEFSLPTGATRGAALYKRSDVIVSAPQTEAIAYSPEPFAFEATALDAPGASFQWRKDGAALSGETSTTLDFPSLAPSDAGRYTLEASFGAKTLEFGPFILYRPLAPAFVSHPSDFEARASSGGYSLSGYAGGRPYANYQWYLDGAPLAGETRPYLTLGAAKLEMLGTYQLRAYNDFGDSWSQPAVAEPIGWWQISETEHVFESAATDSIIRVYPGHDGSAWTLAYDGYASSFSVIKDLPDGARIADWGASLQLGEFSSLAFSRGAPRAFAQKTFSVPDGYLLTQYTTFVRLKADGTIDGDFGEHTLKGGGFDAVLFKEWSDGTVWAETTHAAIEIDPQGNATDLPRPAEPPFSGMHSLTSPFSRRLTDGSYLYLDSQKLHIVKFKPGGEPQTVGHAGGYPDRVIGNWPSGRALVLEVEEKALQGRDLDGSIAWTLPLDEYADAHPYDVQPLVSQSVDGARFHLLVRPDAASEEARVYWVGEDGSTNHGSPDTFELIEQIDQFAHLGGERFAVWGFAQYSNNPDDRQHAYQLLDLSAGPGGPLFSARYRPTVPSLVSPAAPDGSFFLVGSARVDGAQTGLVAKFHADGSLDESFDSSDAFWDINGSPLRMIPLPGGGVAVTYPQHGSNTTVALDATGAIAWQTPSTTTNAAPLAALHGDEALVIAEPTVEGHTLLNRYLLATGALDPTFANGTVVFEKEARDLAVDSQGRIYLLDRGPQSQAVFRHLPTGQRDLGYAFTASHADSQIWSIKIDSKDRLLAVSDLLLRHKTTGAPDLAFNSSFVTFPPGAKVVALPDGSIYSGGALLNEDGSLRETISDSIPTEMLVFRAHDVLSVERSLGSKEVVFRTHARDNLPSVLQAPRSGSAAPGSTRTLSVALDHDGPLSYQWYRDGAPISGATSSNLALADFDASDAGDYQVRVSWAGGSLLFPAAKLALAEGSSPPPNLPSLSVDKVGDSLRLSFEPIAGAPSRLLESSDFLRWRPTATTTVYGEQSTITLPLPTAVSVFLKLELVAE